MTFLSLVIILISGFLVGWMFEKIKLPKIVGMIIVGILIGPSFFNIIDETVLSMSATLRMIALVIILTRSGLSLNIQNLKKIGRPAILMCIVPALFEIAAVTVLAPILLGVSIIEALLIGSVIAAVSPAIVVPRMIKLKAEGYGNNKHIPELIMAGASADDILVIVLFYAFLGFAQGNALSTWSMVQVPLSIVLGIGIGVGVGFLLNLLFKYVHAYRVVKILLMLTISFILVYLETALAIYVPFSALISIMTMGMVILIKNEVVASDIEKGYQKIWLFFEIILFVLVGMTVDINYAMNAGFMPVVVLMIALIFRMLGVYVSLLFTELNYRERLFTMMSYIPKATVQASIGATALSLGLPVGALVLTVAVMSILITAPLGAILIDFSYKKLLMHQKT